MDRRLTKCIELRSTNINLLKFICAISVIVCHSYAVTKGKADFVDAFTEGKCNLGGIAVAIFFFLSGLYVTKSLEKTPDISDYIKKRCVRIFPQLWIVVLLSILGGAIVSKYPLYEYFTNKSTYLYLLNGLLIPVHNLPGVFEGQPYQTVNGPLWTMPVEFTCYIGLAIVSFMARLTMKKWGKWDRIKWDSTVFLGILLMFVYINEFMSGSMLVSIVRPMVIFYEGTLFYDFKDRVKLNPLIGLILLSLLIASAKTPVFNYCVICLLPYSIISIALGLPQVQAEPKCFLCSYEMYLLGWPIQQILVLLNGHMSPALNWIITLPFDILFGMAIFKVSKELVRWAIR